MRSFFKVPLERQMKCSAVYQLLKFYMKPEEKKVDQASEKTQKNYTFYFHEVRDHQNKLWMHI